MTHPYCRLQWQSNEQNQSYANRSDRTRLSHHKQSTNCHCRTDNSIRNRSFRTRIAIVRWSPEEYSSVSVDRYRRTPSVPIESHRQSTRVRGIYQWRYIDHYQFDRPIVYIGVEHVFMLCSRRRALTCMPQRRTPRVDDVDSSHFWIFDWRFLSESMSAYCRLPIFKSNIHGWQNRAVTFSKSMNSTRQQRWVTTKHAPIRLEYCNAQ